MVLKNLCWSLLRISVWGKLHEFGNFRLEKKQAEGYERALAHPEGCEDVKAIAADTKAGESFKTSMRMAFAKQTHNSMVGFAIPNAAKAKSVNGSETDW